MYQRAVEKLGDFQAAHHMLGLSLSKTGQPQRAVEVLERASALAGDPTVLNDLALVYRQIGKINDALSALKKAVALEPDHPQAWNNLGGMLRETGDITGAESAFRQALRAQPDFAAAHTNLANLLMRRQDFFTAQYHLERAIRQRLQDRAVADARNVLGDLMGMQGKLEGAASQYREALKIDPNLTAAHLGLGSILAFQGKKIEALPHLQKAADSPDANHRALAMETIRELQKP
jgi:Flp pilus assembly protein TadD